MSKPKMRYFSLKTWKISKRFFFGNPQKKIVIFGKPVQNARLCNFLDDTIG